MYGGRALFNGESCPQFIRKLHNGEFEVWERTSKPELEIQQIHLSAMGSILPDNRHVIGCRCQDCYCQFHKFSIRRPTQPPHTWKYPQCVLCETQKAEALCLKLVEELKRKKETTWTVQKMIDFLKTCNPEAALSIGYDGTLTGTIDPEIRKDGTEIQLGHCG